MTTSKIIKVWAVNERKGKNKRFYKCDMENEDKLNIMRDSATALKEGDSIEYEKWEVDDYGYCRIKEPWQEKKKSTFQPRDYRKEFISFSASYAKDVWCNRQDFKMDNFNAIADHIYKWMTNKLDALDSNK